MNSFKVVHWWTNSLRNTTRFGIKQDSCANFFKKIESPSTERGYCRDLYHGPISSNIFLIGLRSSKLQASEDRWPNVLRAPWTRSGFGCS